MSAPSQLFGIGLRSEHIEDFYTDAVTNMAGEPAADFLEIHAENFLDIASPRTRALLKIRETYPVSCHALGLSLGSAEGVSDDHLSKIKTLTDILQPMLFSDHVAWSVSGGRYVNDLMPLPLTEESLQTVCDNVAKVQDVLGRQILIENPSSYISFGEDEIPEAEFMRAAAERSGCKILLDLNNIYVSAENHDFQVSEYLQILHGSPIGEIHLAGHVTETVNGKKIRIDTHNKPVPDAVWQIFTDYMNGQGEQKNPPPVLIEWDSDLPQLSVLLGECKKAKELACR